MKSDSCPICLEAYNSTRKFKENQCPNGHNMCKECLSVLITSGVPRRCPECRQQLRLTHQRIRSALHIQLVSMWSVRRQRHQAGGEEPINLEAPLVGPLVPVVREPVGPLPPTFSLPCFSQTLFAVILSLFQWSVLTVNVLFFLPLDRHLSMTLLYILAVQLYQLFKLTILSHQPTRKALIHQSFFFIYGETQMFSSIPTGCFYLINLGIAYAAYYMTFTLNRKSNLSIAVMILNIAQFFLCVIFYTRMQQLINAIDHVFQIPVLEYVLRGLLHAYSTMGFIGIIALFVYYLWPVAILALIPQFVILGYLLKRDQTELPIKKWEIILHFPAISVVLEKSTIINWQKICARLLMAIQCILYPVLIGWIISASCSQLLCFKKMSIKKIIFAISLFSPITLALTYYKITSPN